MLYHVNGELVHTAPGAAVIDCGGVGYHLLVSTNTLSKISGKRGEKVLLYTHMAVKEDSVDLYGFFEYSELTAFRMLVSVSGVGAKTALSLLSAHTPESFAAAVVAGDHKALKVPGVGQKTAERIIVDLKGKIAKELNVDPSGAALITDTGDVIPAGDVRSDILSTLLVLGYTRAEASAVMKGLDFTGTVEDGIRAALRKMGG